MGGDLFSKHHPPSNPSSPTLSTPRLDPPTYHVLKSLYTTLLQQSFPEATRIDTLREAPGKPSYGDIDIFLSFPHPPPSINWTQVATHLGARALVHRGAGKLTLGIPVSGGPWKGEVEMYADDGGKGNAERGVTRETYVQVDLQVIRDGEMEWWYFYSSFGDLAMMLGQIVHGLGFTVRDTAFDLRLWEADVEIGKERGGVNLSAGERVVSLSRDPRWVMRFLGLDAEMWERGFETMEELYGWLEKCRLIKYGVWRVKRDNKKSRWRAIHRPAFTGFFHEWIPKRFPEYGEREIPAEETKTYLASLDDVRRSLAKEAIKFFDKEDEYALKRANIMRRVNTAFVGSIFAEILENLGDAHPQTTSQAKKLKEYIRAFRRFTGVQKVDGRMLLYVKDEPSMENESELHLLVSADGAMLLDRPDLEAFVERHRDTVKDLLRKHSSDNDRPGTESYGWSLWNDRGTGSPCE